MTNKNKEVRDAKWYWMTDFCLKRGWSPYYITNWNCAEQAWFKRREQDPLPTPAPSQRPSWKEYALALASVAATRSEDPYVKVGACALRHDNSVASLGYNGPPPGVNINWSNRDERRKRVVHAECNCLRHVKPGEVKLLALTMSPCSDCVKLIASYGIKEIVFPKFYDKDSFAIDLCEEFGISWECYVSLEKKV